MPDLRPLPHRLESDAMADDTRPSRMVTLRTRSTRSSARLAERSDFHNDAAYNGPSTRSRKRHRIIDEDEDEDDEEDGIGIIMSETSQGPSNAVEARSQQDEEYEPRRITLTVRTSNSNTMTFLVSDTVIWDIPQYSRMLNSAIIETPPGQRVRLVDNKVRDEALMIEMLEFMTDGFLSVISEEPKACHAALRGLIDLYDLAISLEINHLEKGVIDHISNASTIDVRTMVDFAIECYNEDGGHQVTPESLLGQHIKATLAQYLHVLVETGAVKLITDAGGIITQQFTEVFAEQFMESQKQTQPAKVPWAATKAEGED